MKALSVILLCGFALSARAQVDEFRAAFDEFRNQARQEYEDFRSKANVEYAEFVKKAWQAYKTLPAIPLPKEEKVPPVVIKEDEKEERQRTIEDRPVIIEEEFVVPEPLPQPQPISPIREQPEPIAAQTLKFTLYGTMMEVRADERLKFAMPDTEVESIARAWERLASDDYDNLIRDCLELRIRHNLCDWAYLRMLDAMSQAFLGKGTNEAEFLKAFIFCQSGYQMRLAVEGNRLHMLYASQYHIFDKPCWEIDGTLFFADDIKAEQIYICNAEFPHEQAMSLTVNEEQLLADKQTEKRTIQSGDVDWMKATVAENENLMSFCNDYPTSFFGEDVMTRWALYADMPICKNVQAQFYPQLKAWIKGRSKAEAVDILCHWIQTGFEYEYDDKVWGGDRAFFADETLFYPYCDCEDRSILLTRIVRDLLNLPCALVYYPGHLATAIALGEEVRGDFIRINGTKFLICDPTYVNAPIGMTMPDVDKEAAKVIVLK